MLNPKPRRRRSDRAPTMRDLQKAQTMRRLQDAARELFREFGFDGVSISDISKRAGGISPTLIFAHFGSKAGLLYSIVTESNAGQGERARTEAAKARTAMGKLERVVRTWCAMDLVDPKLLAAMQALSWTWTDETEAANAKERTEYESLLAEIIREGQKQREMRPLPVDRAVRMVWAIYTWGLRPAVFDGKSAEACATDIVASLRVLLVAP